MAKLDLLVKNGEVWTPGGFIDADIAVHGGKVIALGRDNKRGRRVEDRNIALRTFLSAKDRQHYVSGFAGGTDL